MCKHSINLGDPEYVLPIASTEDGGNRGCEQLRSFWKLSLQVVNSALARSKAEIGRFQVSPTYKIAGSVKPLYRPSLGSVPSLGERKDPGLDPSTNWVV